MKVTRTFTFSAAHHLTDYHGACERPHGHTYRLAVTVEGEIRKDGLVIDFVELKKLVVDEVLTHLDHTDLNNIFKNPSAEHIAVWIWNKLEPHLAKKNPVKLSQVQLWEGDNTSVTYDGN